MNSWYAGYDKIDGRNVVLSPSEPSIVYHARSIINYRVHVQ